MVLGPKPSASASCATQANSCIQTPEEKCPITITGYDYLRSCPVPRCRVPDTFLFHRRLNTIGTGDGPRTHTVTGSQPDRSAKLAYPRKKWCVGWDSNPQSLELNLWYCLCPTGAQIIGPAGGTRTRRLFLPLGNVLNQLNYRRKYFKIWPRR